MTLTISDPLGLNGFGGTYREVRSSYCKGVRLERVSKDDTRYQNDSLKSKRYFSRQEVVERKLEKFLKLCLKDIKRGTLELVEYTCSNDSLFIEFKTI